MELDFVVRRIWENILLMGKCTHESFFDKDIVVIGVGDGDIYHGIDEFVDSLKTNEDILSSAVELSSLEYECVTIEANSMCVSGKSLVKIENSSAGIKVDVNCRFTFVMVRTLHGWRAVHLHTSLPSLELFEKSCRNDSHMQQLNKYRKKIEKLTEIVEKDRLTGLLNFQSFKEKYQASICPNQWLLILDLDNFKSMNDRYGHLAGNELLISFADRLMSTVRKKDLVCRMGGDEFLLLCKGIQTLDDISHMMSRIYSILDGLKDEYHFVGISAGITRVINNEYLDEALHRADQALYQAKRQGKNRYQII